MKGIELTIAPENQVPATPFKLYFNDKHLKQRIGIQADVRAYKYSPNECEE